MNKHIHVVGRVEIMESFRIVIEKMNHVRGVNIEIIYWVTYLNSIMVSGM